MATKGEVSARSGGVSTSSIREKEPAGALPVPFRDIEGAESIALGFRQGMLELGNEDDGGAVLCGAGLGSDWIILEWNDKTVVVRGVELLKAWVQSFDPETAARIPGAEAPS